VGLMQNLRRGAGRAAFEADRLLRANRVRNEIAELNARIAEDERQLGARLVDLYLAGMLDQPEFEPPIKRILELRTLVQEKQLDLNAILEEQAPSDLTLRKRLP
jgi:hypothetical protein